MLEWVGPTAYYETVGPGPAYRSPALAVLLSVAGTGIQLRWADAPAWGVSLS